MPSGGSLEVWGSCPKEIPAPGSESLQTHYNKKKNNTQQGPILQIHCKEAGTEEEYEGEDIKKKKKKKKTQLFIFVHLFFDLLSKLECPRARLRQFRAPGLGLPQKADKIKFPECGGCRILYSPTTKDSQKACFFIKNHIRTLKKQKFSRWLCGPAL